MPAESRSRWPRLRTTTASAVACGVPTLGLQYWNHAVKSQWQRNYRIRSLDAPDNPVADDIGASMGNEIGLQYFLLFSGVAAR